MSGEAGGQADGGGYGGPGSGPGGSGGGGFGHGSAAGDKGGGLSGMAAMGLDGFVDESGLPVGNVVSSGLLSGYDPANPSAPVGMNSFGQNALGQQSTGIGGIESRGEDTSFGQKVGRQVGRFGWGTVGKVMGAVPGFAIAGLPGAMIGGLALGRAAANVGGEVFGHTAPGYEGPTPAEAVETQGRDQTPTRGGLLSIDPSIGRQGQPQSGYAPVTPYAAPVQPVAPVAPSAGYVPFNPYRRR